MKRSNRKDLTGKRFHKLKVLHYVGVLKTPNGTPRAHWLCHCDCGREEVFPAVKLLRGTKQSCGQCGSPKRIDLTGRHFGRWEVLAPAESRGGRAYWKCRCRCPDQTIEEVNGSSLLRGLSRSCGCLRVLVSTQNGRDTKGGEGNRGATLKHGEAIARTPEYRAWCSMIERCYNPRNCNYKNYGARGIRVCDRWRNSFLNFLEDMGRRPTSKHSLDRINVNGNYEPGNVRWATAKEQMNNQRKRARIEQFTDSEISSEYTRRFIG